MGLIAAWYEPRQLLQRALDTLTLRKGYEAITIKDICDEADVGRSTFYSHYTSKDDLKRSGLEHLRRQLVHQRSAAQEASGAGSGRRLAFSLTMFEHARDHLTLYRTLVGGRGGRVALDAIRGILSDLVRDELTPQDCGHSVAKIPRELVVQYIVGAFMAVMTWWLDGGAKLAPAQIDETFRRLAIGGLRALEETGD